MEDDLDVSLRNAAGTSLLKRDVIVSVQLNYSIGPVMDEVWRQVPDDWDIIMLGHDAGEYWTDETPERGQITRRMRSTWG